MACDQINMMSLLVRKKFKINWCLKHFIRCKGDEVKSKGEYLEEQGQTEQDLPLILKLWDKWTRPKLKKEVIW